MAPSIISDMASSIISEITSSMISDITPATTPTLAPSIISDMASSITSTITPSITSTITPSITSTITPETIPTITPATTQHSLQKSIYQLFQKPFQKPFQKSFQHQFIHTSYLVRYTHPVKKAHLESSQIIYPTPTVTPEASPIVLPPQLDYHPPHLAASHHESDTAFISQYTSYQLSRFLGRGQFGSVYLGEDDTGKPIFAIKALDLPTMVTFGLPIHQTFILYQKMLRQFEHPHINTYLGWTIVENEGQVYSAYCNGGTVHQAIYRNEEQPGVRDLSTVKRWIYQVVSGLVYLHTYGMVHRAATSALLQQTPPDAAFRTPAIHRPRRLQDTLHWSRCYREGRHPLVDRVAQSELVDSDGIDFLKACLEWIRISPGN
ncbi:hypothetical protein BSLG_004013 [Batrachochytrium salamandrivorans]|nr:hypothetical protein BSLG_004013 [Batrachochytrium salamandrivorans]